MKIGYLQFRPEVGDLKGNSQKVELFLERIRKTGDNFDLLVLPELANSGYNFKDKKEAVRFSEKEDESFLLGVLKKYSLKWGTYFVTGFNENVEGILYNSAFLVGKGEILGRYRKNHLFGREKEFFAKGNLGFPVFEIEGVKIGILVCFDWIFPESWRILALKGAQIVCHCANLVLPGMAQRAVPVQAMMNRIFVVCANRIGEERGLKFTGNSLISSFKGEVLQEASYEEEEWGIIEIDPALALDKQITPQNNLFTDRRTDLYQLNF